MGGQGDVGGDRQCVEGGAKKTWARARREAGVYFVCEHAACDGKLACAVCVSMRCATGSWRVLCERAYGVRREAGVCDVRGYTPRTLRREAGVNYVRESMRRATGSWHVQCVRACGVRREAGVYYVCELGREAGVYCVKREHAACTLTRHLQRDKSWRFRGVRHKRDF